MLRAVCLLPTARLTPARGLLTPRSDDRVSPARLGPATRRTGAYRGGTCTRWKRAARRLRPDFLSFACFATHHERPLYPPPAPPPSALPGPPCRPPGRSLHSEATTATQIFTTHLREASMKSFTFLGRQGVFIGSAIASGLWLAAAGAPLAVPAPPTRGAGAENK